MVDIPESSRSAHITKREISIGKLRVCRLRQMIKKLNIAFTSIGRRVELIRAFRNAYHSLQMDGSIIGFDMDPLAPALKLTDKAFIIPPSGSPDYMPTVARLCKEHLVNAIFPLVDPDIVILARNRSLFEQAGIYVVTVSLEAAKLTADKWLTKEFFERLDLTVPRSWLREQIDPTALPYPVFIKPRDGSASKNAFEARNTKELLFFLEYVPNAMIQEYLPGPEITTDVVCDLQGDILGIVSRQRIEVRWGEVSKGITVFNRDILQSCEKIARELRTTGPITVQCLMKEDHPCFTEINARFGGGAPLGIAAGVDSPRWLLAKIAGKAIDIPPIGTYQTGLYMTRYDDSFFLNDVERQQTSGDRL